MFGLNDTNTKKRVIVTTTINPPTEALISFSKMEDWHLVVVGDKKTPHDFDIENATYLSPQNQQNAYKKLSSLLGWNTIQRRNIGFLWALESGAEIIASVDDDNFPSEDWGQNLLVGKEVDIDLYTDHYIYDPISVTNYPSLWHRGFPIQLLQERNYSKKLSKIFVDVEASFWNGDPDIDAICRLEHAPDCNFEKSLFPYAFDGFSPFNSQNTFLTRKALKSYFMFPNIGRMDDIWASYFLQSCGFNTAYSSPTVTQFRNVHNLTDDFEKEIIGYLQSLNLINSLRSDSNSIFNFLPAKTTKAFKTYLNITSTFSESS